MYKRLIWLPAILLMIIIFLFSSQPAEESADLSGGISYRVVKLVSNITGKNWSDEEMLVLAAQIEHPIRKGAHLTEYALLGVSIAFGVLYGSDWYVDNRKMQCILMQLIGSLYAVSDEIHQLFVPGRAGMIGDVMIDSIGVCIGWGIVVGLLLLGRSKFLYSNK